MLQRYYLGCPIWSNRHWVGNFFTATARPADYLAQYATVFNSVEGNSTFYGLPSQRTAERWRSAVPAHFRFSLKFPQQISHHQRLINSEADIREFLHFAAVLGEKAGILFLQLPPSFDHRWLPALESFLPQLSGDFTYALEVRHRDFFDNGTHELHLNELLKGHGVSRAYFHTEVLHGIDSRDTAIVLAQRRKPQMESRFHATGRHPFLRYVGYKTVDENEPHLPAIAAKVSEWIMAGLQPYVFMHSPDDLHAPAICRRFHEHLHTCCAQEVGVMPAWPADTGRSTADPQLSLF